MITMTGGQEPWDIEYYETEMGNAPVFEWISGLPGEDEEVPEGGEKPKTDRGLALWYIDQLSILGLEARPPLVKHLEGKLYELRWKASSRQHRIAYFSYTGRKFVLLHGFIKKTQKTEKKDLNLARERMKDYERRYGR
jgi:phage-related protein